MHVTLIIAVLYAMLCYFGEHFDRTRLLVILFNNMQSVGLTTNTSTEHNLRFNFAIAGCTSCEHDFSCTDNNVISLWLRFRWSRGGVGGEAIYMTALSSVAKYHTRIFQINSFDIIIISSTGKRFQRLHVTVQFRFRWHFHYKICGGNNSAWPLVARMAAILNTAPATMAPWRAGRRRVWGPTRGHHARGICPQPQGRISMRLEKINLHWNYTE